MLAHSLKNNIFIHKLDSELFPTTMIEFYFCGPFYDYGFSGSNIRHSMLALSKQNSVLICK